MNCRYSIAPSASQDLEWISEYYMSHSLEAGERLFQDLMNFRPDVFIQCNVCKGERYNRETLQVKYKGKSLA
jgi:hypothetical protein